MCQPWAVCLPMAKGSFLHPGAPGEQNQNGEDLQTARQHGPAEDQLAQVAVGTEIAGGAHSLQTGADIVEAGQHRGEIGACGEAVQRDDGKYRKENDHIGGEVGVGVVQDLLIHDGTVVADYFYLPGVQHLPDVPAQTLHQQQDPGHLQAAAGGACAGTHHHQAQQYGFGEAGPQVKVRGGIARGSDDGAYLEGGVADGFLQGGVQVPDVQTDQKDAAQDDAEVQPYLLVLDDALPLPEQNQIIAAEVDTEQDHKHGGHVLQRGVS